MSRTLPNTNMPDTGTAPGQALSQALEDRGMTQQELAERLGMAPKTINEIVKGKAPLTHDTALALERVLGIAAGFWNRLEASHQESLARQRDRERLAMAEEWLRGFPLKEMIAKNYLRRRDTTIEQAEELLRFLHVASPVEWNMRLVAIQGYYRRSQIQPSDPNALGVWLQRGENMARALECAPFDAVQFQQTLQALRGCTFETQEVFLPKLIRMCRECGVAVALIPALEGASICGFTRWFSPTKALLQLSDRYTRADVFWFTFFHEAGHILKHGRREEFLELDKEREDNTKEQEADRFAADLLIPSDLYKKIAQDRPYSRAKIESWATQLGVAPCIIVGRLRHEKVLPQTHLIDMLTPIDLTVPAAGKPDEREPPKTLADLFAGRIGGVRGDGKAWSEDTGKAFSEGMEEKFGHNRGQSTP